MALAFDEPARTDGILQLDYGEHLLVWAWRRIAAGRCGCPVLAREFAEAFGEDAREVLATLIAFLQVLCHGARRGLGIGLSGCLALTTDERRLLALIAAAQDDQPALFDSHLAWIARPDARQTLTLGARAIATALSDHAVHLTSPAMSPPLRRAKDDGAWRVVSGSPTS